MRLYKILIVEMFFLVTKNNLVAQKTFEQKMDDDSTGSSWHYHSIFTVSRDSIHQILTKDVPNKLIKGIKISELFIHIEIDNVGNGKVKVVSPIKLIGKKVSKLMTENLQSAKVWIAAFGIDKSDNRKFYTSSLLPFITNKDNLLKAVEQRNKKTKSD